MLETAELRGPTQRGKHIRGRVCPANPATETADRQCHSRVLARRGETVDRVSLMYDGTIRCSLVCTFAKTRQKHPYTIE